MTIIERPIVHDLATLTLVELGELASQEVRLAEAHAVKAVEHAIRCGEILQVARDLCDYGEFGSWLEANFPLSRNTANKWMRLAHYRDEIPENVSGWAMAARAISGMPALKAAHPPFWVERAKAMKKAGYANRTIAREVGADVKSVKVWTDPKFREQEARRNRERKREEARDRDHAARLLEADRRRREIARQAERRGGAAPKLYSLVRQQLVAVEQAISEASSAEERAALEDVARASRRAEARLAEALRCARQAGL